jgi:hypothetical protein
LNEADKAGLQNRKMGPELFKLLADLTNPRHCSPQKIDNAWRKYFGQEPLPETSKRESNENSASTKETPESKGKPCLSWIGLDKKPIKKGSYCLPSTEKEGVEINNIEDGTDVLRYVKKGSVPIYITVVENPLVRDIKVTDANQSRVFIPVKITFKTPSVANQYYKENKSNYSGYTDYTDLSKTEPNIYYGYCAMDSQSEVYWIFYVNINNPDQIDYQKLTVRNQIFTARKNPNADNPPEKKDKNIEYSILKGGSTATSLKWDDLRSKIDGNVDDNANFEEFFGKNIGSTGISFKDYMENIFTSNAANTKRIGEICK